MGDGTNFLKALIIKILRNTILIYIKQLHNLAGGSERLACSLAKSLNKNGFKVIILTSDNTGLKPFYDLENIEILNIPILDFSRKTNFKDIIIIIPKIREILRKVKPNIAIGFNISSYAFLALASINLNIPVIGSDHIVFNHYLKNIKQLIFLLITYPFISSYTFVSLQARETFPEFIQKKSIIIKNPYISNLSINNINKNTTIKNIITVGRLDKQKDHKTAILAFYKLHKKYPNLKFKIYGDGQLKTNLENLIKKLFLNNNIFLMGVEKNMKKIYSKSDLYICSSKYESLGLTVLEAMDAGIPVIGFDDCLGVNQILTNNKNGILVKVKKDRVDSLFSEIDKLMHSKKIYKLIRENGLEYIKNFHNEKNFHEDWIKFLNQKCLKK